MSRTIELGIVHRSGKPDPLTVERGEKCAACGMITTNSQPDCRCS